MIRLASGVSFGMLLSWLFLPSLSFAAEIRASLPSGPDATAWHILVHGGVGVGMFQDIQVPVNEVAGLRGDGRLPAPENQSHIGFPVFAGLGAAWHKSAWYSSVGFEALQMRATSGPAETQSSSYSRLSLGGGTEFRMKLSESLSLVPSGRAHLRRSSFNNVSSAHYIDAVILRAGLGLDAGSWRVDAFAAAAPQAGFFFNSGRQFQQGEAFKSSETNLTEWGLSTSFFLGNQVWLDVGMAQERARVAIADVSEYDGFGLQVTPTLQPSRDYDLSTTIAHIGFRKLF